MSNHPSQTSESPHETDVTSKSSRNNTESSHGTAESPTDLNPGLPSTPIPGASRPYSSTPIPACSIRDPLLTPLQFPLRDLDVLLRSDSSGSNNSLADTTIVEVPLPAAKPSKRKGRKTRAESHFKCAEKYRDTKITDIWTRGEKRSHAEREEPLDVVNPFDSVKRRQIDCRVGIDAIIQPFSVSANPQKVCKSIFSPTFTPDPKVAECPSLSFVYNLSAGPTDSNMSGIPSNSETNEMSQILAAISGLDTKLSSQLSSIASDVQKLKESDERQQERWREVDRRLTTLEERQLDLPSHSLEQLRDECAQVAKERLEAGMQEELGLALTKVDNDLAVNMNRTLEALDAHERKDKKLNLVVSGLAGEGEAQVQSVRKLFSDKFNVVSEITDIKLAASKTVVSVNSWDTKQKILRSKREALSKSKVYINADLTSREQKIAAKLREVAKGKKAAGCDVLVLSHRLKIDGQWYKWDEFRDSITPGDAPGTAQGTNSRYSRPTDPRYAVQYGNRPPTSGGRKYTPNR